MAATQCFDGWLVMSLLKQTQPEISNAAKDERLKR